MNRHLPNSAASRRQFLRDGLRYTVLGGLAAVSARLMGRPATRPAGQVCIKSGFCCSCEAFDDCGLPPALSARERQP